MHLPAFGLGSGGKPARKPAQVIVLLTDGADTESRGGGPIEAAREAARRGVKIYSIGIGSREGDYVTVRKDDGATEYIKDTDGRPVRMSLDETTLQQLASMTGGEYFAFDAERFGVERVQRAIAALERTEEEARVVARAVAEAACGAGAQAQFVETPEQAGEWLARNLRPGDAVLLKASRGVKLERALEMLQDKVPGHSI